MNLKDFNTFGIDCKAKLFIEITSEEQLQKILSTTNKPYNNYFILGGGSNLLLTKDIEETVLKISIKGKEIISRDKENVIVRVSAGENWHDFVMWAVENDYGGIENLALIYGSVGASPIQNIGAYGIEVKNVIRSVRTFDLKENDIRIFDNTACKFGYRDSMFKQEKGRYIILSVDFILSVNNHKTNISYGAIKDYVLSPNPSLKEISEAIIHIRQSKLPNPTQLGNGGSFFKNPIVDRKVYTDLQQRYRDIIGYEQENEKVKIPAGWLIEKSGFKGKSFGECGVYEKQALILVNYGKATGKEILQMANNIIDEVYKRFGVKIEPEINIY